MTTSNKKPLRRRDNFDFCCLMLPIKRLSWELFFFNGSGFVGLIAGFVVSIFLAIEDMRSVDLGLLASLFIVVNSLGFQLM